MRAQVPDQPLALAIVLTPSRNKEYCFTVVPLHSSSNKPHAQSNPFRTQLDGLAALRKLATTTGIPLDQEPYTAAAVRGMQDRGIPIGSNLAGIVLTAVLAIAQRTIRGVLKNTARNTAPSYDIMLRDCGQCLDKHLILTKNGRVIADSRLNITDGFTPPMNTFQRWAEQNDLPPETSLSLTEKLRKMIDEASQYALDIQENALGTAVLIQKNGVEITGRYNVGNKLDVFGALSFMLRNCPIPSTAHASLLEDALNIADTLPDCVPIVTQALPDLETVPAPPVATAATAPVPANDNTRPGDPTTN
ncbi:MAG: hypothetical protein EXS55_04395 [Candidatus Magasanikbacteria bacterium]|nr:hypothetical protein [Candidatus Magasanikbacteria bacterium]